jgi:hypothetical protein
MSTTLYKINLNSKSRVLLWGDLPDSHCKGVDIFIQLVQQGNSLDNHVITLVDVELHFCARIRMSQSKLSFLQIPRL